MPISSKLDPATFHLALDLRRLDLGLVSLRVHQRDRMPSGSPCVARRRRLKGGGSGQAVREGSCYFLGLHAFRRGGLHKGEENVAHRAYADIAEGARAARGFKNVPLSRYLQHNQTARERTGRERQHLGKPSRPVEHQAGWIVRQFLLLWHVVDHANHIFREGHCLNPACPVHAAACVLSICRGQRKPVLQGVRTATAKGRTRHGLLLFSTW